MNILKFWCGTVALLTATGCANESGARIGLFSVQAPVIAVLEDDLFTGTAVGYRDRTGTIELTSVLDPGVRCVGQFRYTGANGGFASVQCTDGLSASLTFNSTSALSGYGVGRTSRGPASFTYGMTSEEAARYLSVPQGRKLQRKPEGPRLVEI